MPAMELMPIGIAFGPWASAVAVLPRSRPRTPTIRDLLDDWVWSEIARS